MLLKERGFKFYAFNPNIRQLVRYVLRGLPPSADSAEVMSRLREKAVEVSLLPSSKGYHGGIARTVTLLPVWGIRVTKVEENKN